VFLVFNSIHRQRLLDTQPSSVERYFDEAVKKAKQLDQLKNKRGEQK
jgi:putative NADH-flavin reductase